MKNAFLFPGQGAQYPSMGKDFFDNFTVAKHIFEQADDQSGQKISELIFNGPEKVLTETKNSQLAIYIVSAAILQVIKQELPELRPHVCSGLSLGEYTAVYASDKIDFVHGLDLVQKRATLMNEACNKYPGGMAAVLGLTPDAVSAVIEDIDQLWIANCNCPNQVVISGKKQAIEKSVDLLKEKGAKRVISLQVHGAFHSGLMQDAQDELLPYLQKAPIYETPISLVMNVPGGFVSDKSEIRKNLLYQVTSPVLWEAGIRSMGCLDLFLEIGPGKTLSGMNKKIGVSGEILSVQKVEDLKGLITYYQEFLSKC